MGGVRAPRAQQAMPRSTSYVDDRGKLDDHIRPPAPAGRIGDGGRRKSHVAHPAGPPWGEQLKGSLHDDHNDDGEVWDGHHPSGETQSHCGGRNPANQHCDRTDPLHGDGPEPALGGRSEPEPPFSPVIEVGHTCLLHIAPPTPCPDGKCQNMQSSQSDLLITLEHVEEMFVRGFIPQYVADALKKAFATGEVPDLTQADKDSFVRVCEHWHQMPRPTYA